MELGGGERSENEPRTPGKPKLVRKPRFKRSGGSSAKNKKAEFGNNNINDQSQTLIHVENMIPTTPSSFSFQDLLQKAQDGNLPLPDGVAFENPHFHYFQVPQKHPYDLNSAPESIFGFAPITPDKSTRSDNFNVDSTSTANLEIEKQSTTTLEKSSFNQNLESVGIDLNITPPPQKQRRKKHRPKVITERKPRTPKPATTPTPTDPTRKKRKYVRKNLKEKASETPAEVTGQSNSSEQQSSPKQKSCKRALNFDEMGSEDEYSVCSSFGASSEQQGHRSCTRGVISKVTVQLCRQIEEAVAQSGQQRNTCDSAKKGVLGGDTQQCSTSPNDSDRSSIVNLTAQNEFKGNYSHAIQQANSSSVNVHGVRYDSVQKYRLISWQNYKKKRSEKVLNHVASSTAFCGTQKYFGGMLTEEIGSKVSDALGQAQKGLRGGQNNGCIVIDISPYERPTKKRSKSSTKARDSASLTRIAEQAMANFSTTEQCESCVDALKAQTQTTLATKKRTKKAILPAVQYSAFQQFYPVSGVLQEVSSTWMLTVDDIERQFKSLDINRESSKIASLPTNEIVPFFTNKEHNTLVLYKGGGGMVVPFGPMKKTRPRPKVDLDEETTRVWKLLLENINSEGIDGTDEAKAKWWQEERRVFRGRADSFIARMHLVQGDRRFSKWKGSVLDSVVGVFLTQNVSDHLSSSAFMYLAARYPLKSRNCDKACVISDEPEVCLSEGAPSQPLCGSSFTPRDPDNEITGPERIETFGSNAEQEEQATIGLISLQKFEDYSIAQTSDKSGSCSESNSDRDNIANRYKPGSLEDSTSLLENLHVEMSLGVKLKDDFIESKATENEDDSETVDKAGPESSKESSMEPSSNPCSYEMVNVELSLFESIEILREEAHSSDISQSKTESSANDLSTITVETIQTKTTETLHEPECCQRELCSNTRADKNTIIEFKSTVVENLKSVEITAREEPIRIQQNLPNHSEAIQVAASDTMKSDKDCGPSLSTEYSQIDAATSKPKSGRVRKEKTDDRDWDQLRKQAEANGRRQRAENTMDSLDWEAIRCADVDEVADTIKERGMNNRLAQRIKEFLNRLVKDHGSMDLEWLRDVPPDQAKEYLLSIKGLGLKSVECVRLLTLHHLAFPVDTNVGRIAVRLGWVPLQPLPESLQLHLLELYPVLETIQKYLWPRLCKLDQRTLYELHYQMITFGKVFCTKNKPNCNACPMRGECRHFASAFASARLALPGPEEKRITIATENGKEDMNPSGMNKRTPLPLPAATKQSEEDMHLVASNQSKAVAGPSCCVPIIEEPSTPEPECIIGDIEDFFPEDPDEIPTIKLNIEEFTQNLQNYMQQNMELQDGDMSKALVAINSDAASIPTPKLKNVDRLRTEHQVYELPDSHPLLKRLQMEKREPDDPSPYLLAIWTPGETPNSITPPENRCSSQTLGKLCNDEECFSCNSIRETNSQTVRGTLLIPCRTAMRGSFPLNGTYFQVNEVFADHDSSLNPIDVPRAWIWNLNRRTVYFGTSIPSIFKGLTTQGIQHCFWRGYVCVRGFDQKSRAPRPLMARLHFPASKGKRNRDPKTEE